MTPRPSASPCVPAAGAPPAPPRAAYASRVCPASRRANVGSLTGVEFGGLRRNSLRCSKLGSSALQRILIRRSSNTRHRSRAQERGRRRRDERDEIHDTPEEPPRGATCAAAACPGNGRYAAARARRARRQEARLRPRRRFGPVCGVRCGVGRVAKSAL